MEKPEHMIAVRRFENGARAPLVSSPERALLELLDEVGVRQPLEEAREIAEGASTCVRMCSWTFSSAARA